MTYNAQIVKNVSKVKWYAINSLAATWRSDFLSCDGVEICFLKIVASPAHGENRICSHPCTGNAIIKKKRQKQTRN